jgi:hypothetical protein
MDVTPPTTTTSLSRLEHWRSARLPHRELKPVPVLLALQFIRRGRSPSETLARRTGFETIPGDYEVPSNPVATKVTL